MCEGSSQWALYVSLFSIPLSGIPEPHDRNVQIQHLEEPATNTGVRFVSTSANPHPRMLCPQDESALVELSSTTCWDLFAYPWHQDHLKQKSRCVPSRYLS